MMSGSDREQPRGIAVIGAGTLGSQIALIFATRGEEVRIFDLNSQASTQAVRAAEQKLETAVKAVPHGRRGALVAAPDLASAVAGAWLVIESVPERLDTKVRLFAELDRIAPGDAILASNSSSLPSSRLIGGVKAPHRVVNLHFYRGRMVVEVMSCGATSPEVIALLMAQLPEYGLHPFEVRKESVGFIYNRIWAAIKRESLAVVAEGVSSPEEVDAIYRLINGGDSGPFRKMDGVGLDVVLDIERIYASENPHLSPGARTLLEEFVRQGKLGLKSSSGFYDDYQQVVAGP